MTHAGWMCLISFISGGVFSLGFLTIDQRLNPRKPKHNRKAAVLASPPDRISNDALVLRMALYFGDSPYRQMPWYAADTDAAVKPVMKELSRLGGELMTVHRADGSCVAHVDWKTNGDADKRGACAGVAESDNMARSVCLAFLRATHGLD